MRVSGKVCFTVQHTERRWSDEWWLGLGTVLGEDIIYEDGAEQRDGWRRRLRAFPWSCDFGGFFSRDSLDKRR